MCNFGCHKWTKWVAGTLIKFYMGHKVEVQGYTRSCAKCGEIQNKVAEEYPLINPYPQDSVVTN